MNARSLPFAAVLGAGLLLGQASAQTIDAVASSDDVTADATVSATVGSVLTIDGSGFGTAKPKVFLTDSASKKYVLKVTAFTDTQITAQIKKATVGDLTLNVQPKGVAVPATSPVTIEPPVVGELQDTLGAAVTSADANAEFVITGDYLGNKKGKIKIGGKAAKVLSWANSSIHVVMPKTLANGLWDILLDNKLATDNTAEITTTNSDAKIGKVKLSVTIGTGPGAEHIDYKFTGNQSSAGYIAFGGTTASFPIETVALVVFFDVATTPVPVDIDSADNPLMTISFTKAVKNSGFPPVLTASWLVVPGTAGLTVHITASGGGQCAGTFTADLPLIADAIGGQPASQHIEGEFVYQSP